MKSFLSGCFLALLSLSSTAQPKTDAFLSDLLQQNKHAVFQQVLRRPETYRLQIIYTQINRDKKNTPSFTNYYFNYDSLLYFNPASTVKLPLALLSLEKLNKLHKKGVDKYTTVYFDGSEKWQRPLYKDTSAMNGKPTMAHLVKRAFLISENDPYNRFYQFVGQGEANKNLHAKGYTDVRITRQFMGLTPEQNRYTNAIRFVDDKGKTIYAQPPVHNTDSFDFSHPVLLGKGYLNNKDSLINAPFDFTRHNNLSLLDLQQILQSVLFPGSVSKRQRFNLTKEDYAFVYRYLSQYPSETPDPKYDTATFYDNYVKFFFQGNGHKLPPNVRVFNKVGWAYGFATDVSYVVDFKANVEFMLSATLYANSDEILNDNKYDYESIIHPFLYQLGQTVYQYELGRPRTYKPDLSSFKMAYESRDPKDARPSLVEVDN